MTRRSRRSGFTLVELLVVSVVIGILAGIATPRLSRAIDRAGAAKVASDVRTLSVAVRSHLENGGALPRSEPWGSAPSALGEFLEETMTFSYRDAEYRYIGQRRRGRALLRVRYPVGSGLGDALQSFRRAGRVMWTPTRTTFVLSD